MGSSQEQCLYIWMPYLPVLFGVWTAGCQLRTWGREVHGD